MSERQPFRTVIASGGIYASGTEPGSKWRLVVPRADMESEADNRPVVWANIGRIVDAAEKRKRKNQHKLKTRGDCRTPPGM